MRLISGLEAGFLEGEEEAEGFPVDGPFQLQNAQTLGVYVEDSPETIGRGYLAVGVVTVVVDAVTVAVSEGVTVSIDVAVTVGITVNLIWDTVTNATVNSVVVTIAATAATAASPTSAATEVTAIPNVPFLTFPFSALRGF